MPVPLPPRSLTSSGKTSLRRVHEQRWMIDHACARHGQARRSVATPEALCWSRGERGQAIEHRSPRAQVGEIRRTGWRRPIPHPCGRAHPVEQRRRFEAGGGRVEAMSTGVKADKRDPRRPACGTATGTNAVP
jgi:hypothetical protein